MKAKIFGKRIQVDSQPDHTTVEQITTFYKARVDER